MNRLGDMLIDEKLVTHEQVEEALETQVIHGGRLGTNLVELGFLQEKDLARLLGKQHNMAYAAGEMLPDPAAIALGDINFFDEMDVLPMRVDQTRQHGRTVEVDAGRRLGDLGALCQQSLDLAVGADQQAAEMLDMAPGIHLDAVGIGDQRVGTDGGGGEGRSGEQGKDDAHGVILALFGQSGRARSRPHDRSASDPRRHPRRRRPH